MRAGRRGAQQGGSDRDKVGREITRARPLQTEAEQPMDAVEEGLPDLNAWS